VGGNAQIKAMKQVAGRLRLDLAQFRELEAFAEFGSDLDKASQSQLDRGARIVEVLKQPQYSPFPVEEQVASIWAVTNGYLDDVPLDQVGRFERELLDHLRSRNSSIGDTIVETGKLEEDLLAQLKTAVEDFKQSWTVRVDGAAAEAAAKTEGE
jgi:F-type H+-transporting ATPase subunit alpha